MEPLTDIQLDFIRVISPNHRHVINELVWVTERYGKFVELFDEKREEVGMDDWKVTTDQELYFLGTLVEKAEERMDELTVMLRRVLHSHFQIGEFQQD